MDANEKIEYLEEIITQANRSHSWMLRSIKHNEEDGNYSDDLKHAIMVQELIEGAVG